MPFLTFFMLLDGRRWVDGALDVLPPGARPRWERVCDGIYRTVGGYVTGNLLISILAGTVAAVTLMAAGVPYALPLAVIVAILDLVPLVGATAALVVCAVAALSQGVLECVIVVIVLLVYQQLENHVLLPVVYGRAVDLSPLGVLVAILIGAELAGVLGALAAIPVAGSVAVVARELVRWRREASLHLPTAVEDGLRHTDPSAPGGSTPPLRAAANTSHAFVLESPRYACISGLPASSACSVLASESRPYLRREHLVLPGGSTHCPHAAASRPQSAAYLADMRPPLPSRAYFSQVNPARTSRRNH